MELIILSSKTYKIHNIISYKINNNMFLPCDSLEIKFFCENDIESDMLHASEVYLYDTGSKIFDGHIDEISLDIDSSSKIMSLYARDKLAYIVDNDVIPASFNNASFNDVAQWCLRGSGVEFRKSGSDKRVNYSLGVGVSCFNALKKFAWQELGAEIYFDENKRLCLLTDSEKYNNSIRVIIGPGEVHKYFALNKTINRADKISYVSVIDAAGQIRELYNSDINKKFRNILGRKIIKQPKGKVYSQDVGEALCRMPNSDMNCAGVSILLSDKNKNVFYNIFAGECMRINGENVQGDYVIHEKELVFDGINFYIKLKGGVDYGA